MLAGVNSGGLLILAALAGLCGIRRERWAGVPGYADRVVGTLLAIIQGDKKARL